MKYSKLTQSIVSYIFVMILIASSLIILHPTKVYAAENVKFSFINSETYNYNIEGDVRTSYNNNGYITILKVGDTAQKVTGSNNGEATIDGVTIKTEYISKQNGTYAGVVYTIENTNTTSKKMYLGEGLDVQIGTNDKAPVTVLDNGRGFYMEDSGHMFNILLRNTYGSTDVTGIWIGSYSEYKNLRDANNFFISQEKNYSGGDSAAFWYWEYTLEPGEVKTFSHSIGVGELNNPPEISDITGVGTNHCTGDLINVSGYVSDENKTDTVNVKYSFDDGTENTLATNIATNGSKKHFNGTITVPSIDSGKHKLTIYTEDNNGNISKAITKEFEAHTIPDIYIYQTNNGIENGIRYKQCTNCGKIIDKEYLLSLDKTAGIEAVTGGGYYKEGKKIVVSAKLGNASGFKCWSGSDLTKQEAIYTMPAQAMKLTATSFYKNKYEHWAWGFKNEGDNSNKTAFLLQTTYGEETYGEEFTPDATYGLTVPNGFYLAPRFGNGQITGKWTTFNFGTKITQPSYVMNFEYDYFPTDYTITYNLNGGTNNSNNPSTYNVLYGVTFSNPTKTGYDFLGWYDANGNKITGINEGCNATFSDTADLYSKLKTRKTGNVSITAKWTPHNYTISYNLNGGTANNKTSYTIETEKFTLNAPTKKGYTFLGWTGSNGTTPQKTVSIAKGSTGNKSYTAIFEKTIYTITTSKVGSGALSDISKVEYDDGTSVFIIPAEGYTTSSLKIDGVSVSPVTKYNFLNVNKDHKVEATFTISQNRKMELMQKGYSWIDLKL